LYIMILKLLVTSSDMKKGELQKKSDRSTIH